VKRHVPARFRASLLLDPFQDIRVDPRLLALAEDVGSEPLVRERGPFCCPIEASVPATALRVCGLTSFDRCGRVAVFAANDQLISRVGASLDF
jgi:hypothetical protein